MTIWLNAWLAVLQYFNALMHALVEIKILEIFSKIFTFQKYAYYDEVRS